MIISKDRNLTYWLLFFIFKSDKDVTLQMINKNLDKKFSEKTQQEIKDVIKNLISSNMITQIKQDEEFRITANGAQTVNVLFQQLPLDEIDYDFFLRYANDSTANFIKHCNNDSRNNMREKKFEIAMKNIDDFLLHLDKIKSFATGSIKTLEDIQ